MNLIWIDVVKYSIQLNYGRTAIGKVYQKLLSLSRAEAAPAAERVRFILTERGASLLKVKALQIQIDARVKELS